MEKKASSKKQELNQEKSLHNHQQASEAMGREQNDQINTSQTHEPVLPQASDDLNQELIDRIKELEARISELNDKHLRLFSEFDNYRKRTSKERIELSKTAAADIVTALLPVVDDLERASTLQDNNNIQPNDLEGITLIKNKLKTILAQKGVEAIDAVHNDFDTDLHEAITHIPAPDPSLKGKVVEILQKGYVLNGKVIRYARVVVAN
ncbi:MAG TPA: nucleotide exchange factor GrpE [Bacteroidales bacterium]|nr:nucleotide exchange factor GrpE [Bacteroidales bacterium]